MNTITDMPLLGYGEIAHSMRFLSFFAHYAKPLYGFSSIEFNKKFLPILLCTQGLVYKADFEIELRQKRPNDSQGKENPWAKESRALLNLLKTLDVYTEKAEEEAANLLRYWQLENQMMQKNHKITHDDLMLAIDLRASDIMILHQICQKITRKPLGEHAMVCLHAIEVIRDVEADFRQYEADVKSNDFNIYRKFLQVYGSQGTQLMQNELEQRQERYRHALKQLSVEEQTIFNELTRRYYDKRPPIHVPEPLAEVNY